LGNTGEGAALRYRQLSAGLSEIMLCGGLDTVTAVGEVDGVEIHFENLGFRKLAVQLQGEDDLKAVDGHLGRDLKRDGHL
jgi:hypothetical protein